MSFEVSMNPKCLECQDKKRKKKYSPFCSVSCSKVSKFGGLTSKNIIWCIINFWLNPEDKYNEEKIKKIYKKTNLDIPTSEQMKELIIQMKAEESKVGDDKKPMKQNQFQSSTFSQSLTINRLYPDGKKFIFNTANPHDHIKMSELIKEFEQSGFKWAINTLESKNLSSYYRGFFLDFDIGFNNSVPQINGEIIYEICDYIRKIFNKNFYNIVEDGYNIFVCRRPLPVSAQDLNSLVLKYSEKKKYYKDGLHIYIPEILADKDLRRNIIYLLQDGIQDLFNQFGIDYIDNGEYLLDSAPSVNGSHFLYMSDKNMKEDNKPFRYKLQYQFRVNKKGNLVESDKIFTVADSKKIPELDCCYWGIEKLTKPRVCQLSKDGIKSVQYIKEERLRKQREAKEKDEKYRPSAREIKIVREKSEDVLKFIESWIVDILDINRAENTKKWKQIIRMVKGLYFTYFLNDPDDYEKYDDYRGFDNFCESEVEVKIFDIIHRFSQRADNYIDVDDVYRTYNLYSPDYSRIFNLRSVWYLAGKKDRPDLHHLFWRKYFELIPRDVFQEEMKLEVFRDYIKLVGKSLPLKIFQEWIDKCICIVDGGGSNFDYYCLNYEIDEFTGHKYKKWKITTDSKLSKLFDIEFYLQNPNFKPYLPVGKNNMSNLNHSSAGHTLNTAINWLYRHGKIKSYYKCDFMPYLDKPQDSYFQSECLNTFHGFAIKNLIDEGNDSADDVIEQECLGFEDSPIYHHIKKYICANRPELLNYYLNWIAHLIQKPAENPEVSLVLISKQGIGKDFMAKFIADLVGHRYYADVGASTFFSKFNSILSEKLLITINELKEGGKQKENHNKLKKIICQRLLNLEKKGRDIETEKWFARLVLHSNDFSVVKVEDSDRRFVIFHCDNSILEIPSEKKEYFNTLWGFVQSPNYNKTFLIETFKYFAGRDISKWQPRDIPENNNFKTEHIIENLSSPIKFMYDLVSEYEFIQDINDKANDNRAQLYKEQIGEENEIKTEIIVKASELFGLYTEYCKYTKIYPKQRTNFHNDLLRDLNIPKTSKLKKITYRERRDRFYRFDITNLQNRFRTLLKNKNLEFDVDDPDPPRDKKNINEPNNPKQPNNINEPEIISNSNYDDLFSDTDDEDRTEDIEPDIELDKDKTPSEEPKPVKKPVKKTKRKKTPSEETKPVKTKPVKTPAEETKRKKTKRKKTPSEETKPVKTKPVKTKPVKTKPVKTKPVKKPPKKIMEFLDFGDVSEYDSVSECEYVAGSDSEY